MNKSHLLGAVSAGVFALITTSAHAAFIEHDFLTLSGVPLVLFLSDGSTVGLSLNGDAQYDVTFPSTEGSASDGDADGREEVPTQMISLNLTGNSGSFGPVAISLSPAFASTGLLEEQVNANTGILDVPPFIPAPSAVDSFFDIFLDISVGGGILHNHTPAHISASWSHKPPQIDEFVAMFTNFAPVELFDDNGNPTGLILGPGPVLPLPPALWLLGSGLLGLIGISRYKKTV